MWQSGRLLWLGSAVWFLRTYLQTGSEWPEYIGQSQNHTWRLLGHWEVFGYSHLLSFQFSVSFLPVLFAVAEQCRSMVVSALSGVIVWHSQSMWSWSESSFIPLTLPAIIQSSIRKLLHSKVPLLYSEGDFSVPADNLIWFPSNSPEILPSFLSPSLWVIFTKKFAGCLTIHRGVC